MQRLPASTPGPPCHQPMSSPHTPRGEATSLAHTYTVVWRASLTPCSPFSALNTKVFCSMHLRKSKRHSTDAGNAAMPAQGFASPPCKLLPPRGKEGLQTPWSISQAGPRAGSRFREVWGHLMVKAGSARQSIPNAALLCSIHLR